jgi:pimeloyl-ACP methyl ester carboxylesterase
MADPAGGEPAAYQPRVAADSRYLTIRGLRYHLREWRTGRAAGAAEAAGGSGGGAGEPPLLLMLHGWMDVSASFQFVVDALERDWRVVAPDWRGFGLSEGAPGREWSVDGYTFADYFGDLDALLHQLSPAGPVRLVAHSMGGNIAMLYAGMRPERVAGLVNLEGFGMPGTDPAKAVLRYRQWLDELREPAVLRPYPTLEAVAGRLIRNNPRLAPDKARFLASHWARPLRPDEAGSGADGGYVLRADPAHKRINPVPYRVDEALSCWAAATAPVLWVTAAERSTFHRFTLTAEYRRRLTVIARLTEVEVADAGHMLHHDQPARLARLIEDFFE